MFIVYVVNIYQRIIGNGEPLFNLWPNLKFEQK